VTSDDSRTDKLMTNSSLYYSVGYAEREKGEGKEGQGKVK